MNLVLTMQDGVQVPVNHEGYSAQEFVTGANTQGVNVVMVGSMVINKNMIKYIVSAEPPEQEFNIQIQLTDGTNLNDYVGNYNPAEIVKQFNDPRTTLVAIGDTVVSKNAFKLVKQLTTETA